MLKRALLIFVTIFLNSSQIIDLNETKDLYSSNSALFIDAREFKLYKKGTIAKALNVPLKRYKRMKKWLPIDKNATLVLFCGGLKCDKSSKLAKKLQKLGYSNLLIFKAGYPEWKRHKLPIMATPKKCSKKLNKFTVVNGVKIYLEEKGIVDGEWISKLVNSNSLPKSIALVDVRPKKQFRDGHLKNAINIPYNPKTKSINVAKLPKDSAILFYCNQGSISLDAYDSLNKELKKRVFILQTTLFCENKKCTLEP